MWWFYPYVQLRMSETKLIIFLPQIVSPSLLNWPSWVLIFYHVHTPFTSFSFISQSQMICFPHESACIFDSTFMDSFLGQVFITLCQCLSGSLGELVNMRCWAPPLGCLIYRFEEEQKYLHLQQAPGGAAVSEGRVGESKGEKGGGGYTLRATLCLILVPFCLSADLCQIKLRATSYFIALFLNVNNCPWCPIFF